MSLGFIKTLYPCYYFVWMRVAAIPLSHNGMLVSGTTNGRNKQTNTKTDFCKLSPESWGNRSSLLMQREMTRITMIARETSPFSMTPNTEENNKPLPDMMNHVR